MKIIVPIILLTCTTVFSADNAYKKQIELKLKGSSSGYTFAVPDDVYKNSSYPDLRGMRIINSTGDFVPMRVFFAADEITYEYSQTTLPVFKLNKTISKSVESQQTRITVDGTHEDYTVTTSKSLNHFLEKLEIEDPNQIIIDATIIKDRKIENLEIQWQFKTKGNRTLPINLLASNDLIHWIHVKDKQQLAEININSRILLENRIALDHKAYAYYKIHFTQGIVPEITQVKAWLVNQAIQKSQQIKQVAGYAIVSDNSLRLSTGGAYTLDSFVISFNQDNTITDLKLFTRDNVRNIHARGKYAGQGTIYSMTSNGITVKKNTIKVRKSNKRLWQIQFDDNINIESINKIEMNWRRQKVEFLAQGKAPFTLVYANSKRLKPVSNSWYSRLPEELKKTLFSSEIVLKKNKYINKKTRLKSAGPTNNKPTVDSHYAKWIFWMVLTLVLSLLIVMAYKLIDEVED